MKHEYYIFNNTYINIYYNLRMAWEKIKHININIKYSTISSYDRRFFISRSLELTREELKTVLYFVGSK